jgi:membrane-associated protease RseP (regulator of RpoE activity)
VGPVAAMVGGVKEVGNAISESLHQITHVFGPSGIGRVFTLLFTNAKRGTQDPTSVVGIGQAVGQTGSAGDWGAVLYFLAFVTVFIGLVNLVPLPPFDGGHLAVLLLEKIRGKQMDMRKLIPVSAVVMSFFIVFVLATILLDITKPINFSP